MDILDELIDWIDFHHQWEWTEQTNQVRLNKPWDFVKNENEMPHENCNKKICLTNTISAAKTQAAEKKRFREKEINERPHAVKWPFHKNHKVQKVNGKLISRDHQFRFCDSLSLSLSDAVSEREK